MKQHFKHAMIMAGGGSRFGYYLGIYKAFVDVGKKPDVIFATCGGSISAGIISSFSSIAEQKDALLSREIHQMLSRINTAKKQSLLRVLSSACGRYLCQQPTDTFPDLYHEALFEVSEDDRLLFPFTPKYSSNATEFAIIGSSLCFSQNSVGNKRGDLPLFDEVIFSSKLLTQVLLPSPFLPKSPLINDGITAETCVSFQEAIRISLADIYYLPPYRINQRHYMGGMIDLIPFNLATRCAKTVTLENKQPFSSATAVPAFKKLLGFDPNKQKNSIPRRRQDTWIDTSDSPYALKDQQIKKQIQWRENRIKVQQPNYDDFVKMMNAQYLYGYQRGLQALNASQ